MQVASLQENQTSSPREGDAFTRCIATRSMEQQTDDTLLVSTIERCRILGQSVVAVYMGEYVQFVSRKSATRVM